MRKRGGASDKSGFTIIEVMLTLAISGLVLVGALVGVSGTISRQRYRDTVESIASVLRKQYDLVSRVQIEKRTNDDDNACKGIYDDLSIFSGSPGSSDRGRSKCNVYGVAITLGLPSNGGRSGQRMQVVNLIGKDLGAYRTEIEKRKEDPDDVLRGLKEIELYSSLSLTDLYAEKGQCKSTNILTDETYKWGATIETTTKGRVAKMLIIIARSARDGAIHTYAWDYSSDSSIQPMDYTGNLANACNGTNPSQNGKRVATVKSMLKDVNRFSKTKDVKLCIQSDDALATYGQRRMIKIAADGHNSSAVELINMDAANEDGEGNECR